MKLGEGSAGEELKVLAHIVLSETQVSKCSWRIIMYYKLWDMMEPDHSEGEEKDFKFWNIGEILCLFLVCISCLFPQLNAAAVVVLWPSLGRKWRQQFGLLAHSGWHHVQLSLSNHDELNCCLCSEDPDTDSNIIPCWHKLGLLPERRLYTLIHLLRNRLIIDCWQGHIIWLFDLQSPSPAGCSRLLLLAHCL